MSHKLIAFVAESYTHHVHVHAGFMFQVEWNWTQIWSTLPPYTNSAEYAEQIMSGLPSLACCASLSLRGNVGTVFFLHQAINEVQKTFWKQTSTHYNCDISRTNTNWTAVLKLYYLEGKDS